MENITVELDQDLLHQLMLMAHEQDITLNQLVNMLLKEYLERVGPNTPA